MRAKHRAPGSALVPKSVRRYMAFMAVLTGEFGSGPQQHVVGQAVEVIAVRERA